MFSWFNAQIKITKQIPDASIVHYDTVCAFTRARQHSFKGQQSSTDPYGQLRWLRLEPQFPGFSNFVSQFLSKIKAL